MALQTIATAMAAAGYFLRSRVKALFTRSNSEKPTLMLPVLARKNNS
jgi:hypothetical protein